MNNTATGVDYTDKGEQTNVRLWLVRYIYTWMVVLCSGQNEVMMEELIQ